MGPIPIKQMAAMDHLRAAGARGMTSPALAELMDMRLGNTNLLLAKLLQAGAVGCWPDPVRQAMTRQRWWAAECLPPRAPAPSGEPVRKAAPRPVRCAALRSITEQTVGLGWRKVGKPATPAPAPVAAPAVQRLAGWTHDQRYQVPPGAQVYGAGFAAVGIGRDVITGRAWGAR